MHDNPEGAPDVPDVVFNDFNSVPTIPIGALDTVFYVSDSILDVTDSVLGFPDSVIGILDGVLEFPDGNW